MQLIFQFYPNIWTTNNLTPWVIGYSVFIHVSIHSRGKLNPWAIICVFVRYSLTQKGTSTITFLHEYFMSLLMSLFRKGNLFSLSLIFRGSLTLLEKINQNIYFFLTYLFHIFIGVKIIFIGAIPVAWIIPTRNWSCRSPKTQLYTWKCDMHKPNFLSYSIIMSYLLP